MESLTNFVTLLIALSIASERLVEIIKNAIPWLNNKNTDAKKEGWRKSLLQTLAVIAGIVTAYLAAPFLGDLVSSAWKSKPGLLALGLLISGGSGMWNTVLSYLLNVKNIKAAQLKQLESASGSASEQAEGDSAAMNAPSAVNATAF